MSSENALLPRVWELERSLATAVRVNESLRQQLAASQVREVMLRNALEKVAAKPKSHEAVRVATQALAAPADLSGLVLCEKEPCRDDGRCQYAIDPGAEESGHCPDGRCRMPLFSAWRPK